MKTMTGWALLSAVVVSVAACSELPNERWPKTVAVVFDPAKGNLPAPNDLALVDGLVQIAPNPFISDAENELKAGFNGVDGFSAGSSVRVQFTGSLSAASVTDATVVAFDLGEKGRGPITKASVSRTWAECDRSLTLGSATGFLNGHTYLFAVRGGAEGVRGQNDEEVVESPAFHYLRAGKDLRQHPDAMPGATRAEKAATAERLEGVRRLLEPHFQTLEAQGMPRREVIALWTVTVMTRSEAFFDPNSKRIPFPNQLLMDPATGLVAIPPSATDSAEQAALKRGFNQLDGFSTTAGWKLEATSPIDRTTVTHQTVRAFEYPSLTELTELDFRVTNDGLTLWIQPRLSSPLKANTRYVVLVAGVKDQRSQPLVAMPLASVLKLGRPLTDAEGKSTLGNLCDGTAAVLEQQRAINDAALRAAGLDRAQVQAAWTFKTLDIQSRVRALWETPYAQNLPLTFQNVKSENQFSLNLDKKISGTLTTWDRLDPSDRAFKPNGAGEPRQIEFVLWTPKNVPSSGKVPVVIIGHGLTSDRNMAGPLAERLASIGMATFAIDFPLHGERTVCTKPEHCASGSTCAADGACRKPDGSKGDFAALQQFALADFPGARQASLDAFIDVPNLFGTRDHFRQAIIDLSAQTRLVRLADFAAITGGVGLDADHLHYTGVSLGGILGGLMSGIDPSYKAMLLNVGGADFVDLMQDSTVFGGRLRDGLAEKGITEGSPAFDQFIGAARWALDEVDPLNNAPYAMTRPLVYRDPLSGQTLTARPKDLRLQMAVGDLVVPNSSTERLVTATGINRATQFRDFVTPLNHVFLLNPISFGQADMADFLEGR